MRIAKILCVLMFFVSVPVSARDGYKFMVFGDSLSAGYRLPKEDSFAEQLQIALTELGYAQVVVINNSKSGETTAGGLNRQKQALEQKPDGVILELGINDVLRGVGIETIRENLSKLITNFQKAGVSVLLAGMKAPPITEPAYADRFFDMYRVLSQKYHVVLYPFFMRGIFNAAGNQYESAVPYLLPDRAHPRADGVSLMVEDMLPTIERFLNKEAVYPMR